MELAIQPPFHITEILEQILLYLEPRDIIVYAQRVCKQWQQFPCVAFYDAGYLANGLRHAFIKAPGGPFLIPSGGFRDEKCMQPEPQRLWLSKNAGWRQMQIAQPPITKLYWELFQRSGRTHGRMPAMQAEFTFPGGIRTGDYYDLIAGTCACHEIFWPEFEWPTVPMEFKNQEREFRDPEVYGEEYSQAISDECGLRIAYYPDPGLCSGFYDGIWTSTALQKYHANLTNFQKLEKHGEPGDWIYSYKTQPLDSEAAMEKFIKGAQPLLVGDI